MLQTFLKLGRSATVFFYFFATELALSFASSEIFVLRTGHNYQYFLAGQVFMQTF
jgi:hypothetical protein